MSLSVVTFNLLFERYYAKYSELPRMPAADRDAVMRNVIKSLVASLFLVQESHFLAADGVPVFGPTFKYVRAPIRGESCGIAFDTTRFDMICANDAQFTYFSDPRNGAQLYKLILSAVLLDKETQLPLRVTSVHVPWAADKASQAAYLGQILNHLEATRPKDLPELREIVAGDFNIDQRASREVLDAAFPTGLGWREATQNIPWSVAAARGALDKIDFVYVKGFNVVAEATMQPSSPHDLVKHSRLTDPEYRESPPFTDKFCSDHAALTAFLE